MAKPVRLRALAATDVDHALEHHRREAGDAVAARFVDDLQRATVRIGRFPHAGSLRFAYDLDIPDLRCVPLRRFPYLVFYVEADDRIDVWRVLHTSRDLAARLGES